MIPSFVARILPLARVLLAGGHASSCRKRWIGYAPCGVAARGWRSLPVLVSIPNIVTDADAHGNEQLVAMLMRTKPEAHDHGRGACRAMSDKVVKALEQAQRDRTLQSRPRATSRGMVAGNVAPAARPDTPPLLPLPDCRIIGKHVDGFLLVVRAHRTRGDDAPTRSAGWRGFFTSRRDRRPRPTASR